MFYYIKKYPFSLLIAAAVIYLSFFKPPHTFLEEIPNMDKIVHACMYMGLSGMLWLEFLRNHRNGKLSFCHGWAGALVCPALFGGCAELGQEYLTAYRGGDWMDFAANTTGAVLASLIAYFVIRPKMIRK